MTSFRRIFYIFRFWWSKWTYLHRLSEKNMPSLSNQARFASLTLKVAWSGKSLIRPPTHPHPQHTPFSHFPFLTNIVFN